MIPELTNTGSSTLTPQEHWQPNEPTNQPAQTQPTQTKPCSKNQTNAKQSEQQRLSNTTKYADQSDQPATNHTDSSTSHEAQQQPTWANQHIQSMVAQVAPANRQPSSTPKQQQDVADAVRPVRGEDMWKDANMMDVVRSLYLPCQTPTWYSRVCEHNIGYCKCSTS